MPSSSTLFASSLFVSAPSAFALFASAPPASTLSISALSASSESIVLVPGLSASTAPVFGSFVFSTLVVTPILGRRKLCELN